MIPLKTQHIKSDYPLEDTGISVKNLLELIKDHEYYDLLFDQLNIIDIYDDFIEIRGAKTLFDHLINLKSNFLKQIVI